MVESNNVGIREAIGAVTSPWLLIGSLGGAVAGRRRDTVGARKETAATLISLVGFYVANCIVLDPEPPLPVDRPPLDGRLREAFHHLPAREWTHLRHARRRVGAPVSIVLALIVGPFFNVESGIQLSLCGGDKFGISLLIGVVELAAEI